MEITLKINHTNDKRAFRYAVEGMKDFDARWNAASKTWTIDLDRSIKLKVLKDWDEYQDMADLDIVRTHLKVGRIYTEIGTA